MPASNFRLKTGFSSHPKVAALLAMAGPTAGWHWLRLIEWAVIHSPADGSFAGMSDWAIEKLCGWNEWRLEAAEIAAELASRQPADSQPRTKGAALISEAVEQKTEAVFGKKEREISQNHTENQPGGSSLRRSRFKNKGNRPIVPPNESFPSLLLRVGLMEKKEGNRRLHDWSDHQEFVIALYKKVEQARKIASLGGQARANTAVRGKAGKFSQSSRQPADNPAEGPADNPADSQPSSSSSSSDPERDPLPPTPLPETGKGDPSPSPDPAPSPAVANRPRPDPEPQKPQAPSKRRDSAGRNADRNRAESEGFERQGGGFKQASAEPSAEVLRLAREKAERERKAVADRKARDAPKREPLELLDVSKGRQDAVDALPELHAQLRKRKPPEPAA